MKISYFTNKITSCMKIDYFNYENELDFKLENKLIHDKCTIGLKHKLTFLPGFK